VLEPGGPLGEQPLGFRRVLGELLGRVVGGRPEADRLVAVPLGVQLRPARVGGVLLGLRQLPPRPRRDRRDLQVKRRGVGEGGELRTDPLVELALGAQPGERRRVLTPGLLKQLTGALLRAGNRTLLPNGGG
jgi:hypothetical protein